jgi:hypothetical protein
MKEDSTPKKSAWRRRRAPRWRRFFAVLALLVALVVAGAVLWFFLPMGKTPVSRLMPDNPFAFISYNVDPSDPAVAAIVSIVKDRAAGPGKGLKSSLIRFLVPAAVPRNLTVVLAADAKARRTDVVVLVGMGRMARLLRIYSDPLDERIFGGAPVSKEWSNGRRFTFIQKGSPAFGPSVYAVIGDTLVLGTGLYPVMQCADRYDHGAPPGDAETEMGSQLERLPEEKDAVIYADNAGGGLSRAVQAASQRFAFSAFPSIDAVLSVQGRVRLLPDRISGSLRFVSVGSDRLEEIGSDVRFLYGACRRLARGAGMAMSGNVTAEGDAVVLDFEIPDYLKQGGD